MPKVLLHILPSLSHLGGARGLVVGFGTMLKAGRSRVRVWFWWLFFFFFFFFQFT
jgi:hypothetical protein